MKSKTKYIQTMVLATLVAGGLVFTSGCVVQGPPGPVAVDTSASVDVGVDTVPDSYCWDGDEYVGVVGGQYYYLGPGNAWVVCDPVRLERFHAWTDAHPDWQSHMVRNDRFRNGARQAQTQQRREDQINDTQQRRENQITDTQQRRENQINDTQQRRENRISDTDQKRQARQDKQKEKEQDSGH